MPRGGPDGGDGGDGGDVVLVADPRRRDLSGFRPNQKLRAGRGGGGGGRLSNGARGDDAVLAVPVGTQVFEGEELVSDLAQRRCARRRGEGRQRRPRQQALRGAEPADAALRRGRPARRGARDRASPQAPRGRRARRSPERRQVVAPDADLERAAEGRGVSVHDALAGARDGGVRGRPPAGRRRRPRADRGRERGRRSRPRVPRPPRARPRARARDRLGRGRRRRALAHDRRRARRLRSRARRAAADRRPEQDRSQPRAAGLRHRGRADPPRPSRLRRDRRGPRRAAPDAVRARPARGGRACRRPRTRSSTSSSTGRSRLAAAFRVYRTERGFRVTGTPPAEEELEAILKAAGARAGDEVEVGEELLEWE